MEFFCFHWKIAEENVERREKRRGRPARSFRKITVFFDHAYNFAVLNGVGSKFRLKSTQQQQQQHQSNTFKTSLFIFHKVRNVNILITLSLPLPLIIMEPPVALRPEEISDDLICSVCLELPLDPVLTKKCQHLFCRSCITEALGLNNCNKCPIDRTSCRVSQLVPLQGFSKRIWSSIKVKCSKSSEGMCLDGFIR